MEEESCTDVKLIVAVNEVGEICALQQVGEGSIDQSMLLSMITVVFLLCG